MPLLELCGFTSTHDPVIVKENGLYYRFQTGPGIPVAVSDNLCSWKYCRKVFDENPRWTSEKIPGSTHFWAPEVVFRDGWWRIYYSVSTFGSNRSAIGLARSRTLDVNSAEYGWEDLGAIIESVPENNYNCIDPALIRDENGTDVLLFGSFWGGLQEIALGADGFVKKGEKPVTVASRGTNPNPIEGGYLFKHEKYYYLFASHDFCCRGTASSYHIVVGRSESVCGPFYDDIGVSMSDGGGTTLRNGLSYSRWAGPGHNTVFADTDNKIYLVYHAYDRLNNGEPELQIEELKWNEYGWPEF